LNIPESGKYFNRKYEKYATGSKTENYGDSAGNWNETGRTHFPFTAGNNHGQAVLASFKTVFLSGK
jgi:hypothetical protein